jgi:hypothetical protein
MPPPPASLSVALSGDRPPPARNLGQMLALKSGDRGAFVRQHAARLPAGPPGVALPLQFQILFDARFAHRGLHRPRCHHFWALRHLPGG